MNEALLQVEGLTIGLGTASGGHALAVDGVSLSVGQGEIVGLAGESGSGKTLTALSILGLLPPGARASGSVLFRNRNLLQLSERQLADVRGLDIAMVFQDPLTSLHPMLSIGRQMTEHLRRHRGLDHKSALERAADLLTRVRIPNPQAALRRFPHQFSGGMRQRVAIASALCCEPQLLIADEPTTALDVTVQAGILRLLNELRETLGLSVLIITHDLGVMSALADRVAVMYAGRIVETGARHEVLARSRHPYTRGLLDALPHVEDESRELRALPGSPPALGQLPSGCAFHPRCGWAEASCGLDRPDLAPIGERRQLACPVDPLREVTA